MTIGRAVEDRLATATAVESRVYPSRLPQRPTLPAKTYEIIATDREHAMGADPGHVHARIQVDDYAETYDAAASGAADTRTALSRFIGTATGVQIDDVFADDERDLFEDGLEDDRRVVYRKSQDFVVHYRE